MAASPAMPEDGTICVAVQSVGGHVLAEIAACPEWTVSELVARLNRELPAPAGRAGRAGQFEDHQSSGGERVRSITLLHKDKVLSEAAIVGDVLGPARAELTAVMQQFIQAPARDVHGAHTDNPSYFRRLHVGDFEECLELKSVCWFQVGATFTDVPAGDYRVIVEAARCEQWTPFEIRVEPGATMWVPDDALTPDFQTFEVAHIELSELRAELRVELWNVDGSWKSGFRIKSISLA